MQSEPPAPRYLDLATWSRRDAFDYFRAFDKPYFNVCVRVDAAPLKAAVKARGIGSFSLAYHHLALRLANEIEPFRYRLRDGRVCILDEVAGGATVLRDDDSFGFAYLPHTTDWAQFAGTGSAAIAAARQRQAGFEPRVGFDGLIHFTTLPWLHFSSFSHARNWGREDSIPKISFGRADAEGPRLWLPVSVEVHHALMDGLHVGRYVQRLEAAMADPAPWLAPGADPAPSLAPGADPAP
jgi:chloramphenicol O-acetyltransferase type A